MIHAQKCALTRYGVEISESELGRMAGRIQRGEAHRELRKLVSQEVEAWTVWSDEAECEICVVYDPGIKRIKTVLPLRKRPRRDPRTFKQFDDLEVTVCDLKPDGDFCEIPHEHAVNTALRDQLAAIFGKQNA